MKKLLILALVAFTTQSFAQKMKVVQGDLSVLKGQSSINVEYVYDGQTVGKYSDESEYIADRKAKYNEKEAGRGDHWAEEWVNDRHNLYEPKFEELLKDRTGWSISKDAPYTIILKTTKTEPGFNIGITKQPAYINTEATVVSSDNKDKVLCKVVMTNAPGQTFGGADFATGPRIAEAYAKTGKSLGALIVKQTK